MTDTEQSDIRVLNTCAHCGQRPGTFEWGDLLAQTHGFTVMVCEVCALEAQLQHARERAALIPELERKLAAVRSRS